METELCAVAPSDWEIKSVDDVCVRVTSGGTPSRRETLYYTGGTWPWVKTQELQDKWIDDTEEHITDEAVASSSAKVLPARTVLVAMYGATVGQLGILRRPMTCNQACSALVVDPSAADYRYLYYQLLHIRPQLKALATGAAQQNLSGVLIKSLRLPFPPLSEQRAIAHILGTLDDKIELNRRMNETLEAMARALFKSWFVDFDPVRARMEGRDPGLPQPLADLFPDSFEDSELGEIPRGWEVGAVADLAEVSSGKRPNVRFPEASEQAAVPLWGGNGPMAFVTEALVDEPILLTGRVGTLGSVFRITTPCWPSDNTLVLRANQQAAFEYLFLQLQQIDFDSLNRGSTQPLLTQTDLKAVPLLLPESAVLEHFSIFAHGLYKRVDEAVAESRTLAQLRDALLPKLISGELRVKDAEAFLKERGL